MEKANNFNYEDICRLCREHYQEIVERKNLSYILQNRKVRYIDPEGRFDYTTFGNFYVTSRNVMMLVTREPFIARYHRPDSMRDSLWSAVPVLFAGVETGGVGTVGVGKSTPAMFSKFLSLLIARVRSYIFRMPPSLV